MRVLEESPLRVKLRTSITSNDSSTSPTRQPQIVHFRAVLHSAANIPTGSTAQKDFSLSVS